MSGTLGWRIPSPTAMMVEEQMFLIVYKFWSPKQKGRNLISNCKYMSQSTQLINLRPLENSGDQWN